VLINKCETLQSRKNTRVERKVRLLHAEYSGTLREGRVYLWAACLSAGRAGCLAHCLWRDAAAEPQGQGGAAERGELGCCQFLMGARAAESCPCADEGHRQGVWKRRTAAAGPASRGSPTWRPSVSCQRSLGGEQGGERTWAPGS